MSGFVATSVLKVTTKIGWILIIAISESERHVPTFLCPHPAVANSKAPRRSSCSIITKVYRGYINIGSHIISSFVVLAAHLIQSLY